MVTRIIWTQRRTAAAAAAAATRQLAVTKGAHYHTKSVWRLHTTEAPWGHRTKSRVLHVDSYNTWTTCECRASLALTAP